MKTNKSLHSSTFKGYVKFKGRCFRMEKLSTCNLDVQSKYRAWFMMGNSELNLSVVDFESWKHQMATKGFGVRTSAEYDRRIALGDLSEAKKGGFWRRQWTLRGKTEQRENPGDQNKLIKEHFGRVNVYYLRQSCLRFWSIRKFSCCLLPLLVISLEFSPKHEWRLWHHCVGWNVLRENDAPELRVKIKDLRQQKI